MEQEETDEKQAENNCMQVEDDCMQVAKDYTRVEKEYMQVENEYVQNEIELGAELQVEDPNEDQQSKKEYDYKMYEVKGEELRNEDYCMRNKVIYKEVDVEKYSVDYMRENVNLKEHLAKKKHMEKKCLVLDEKGYQNSKQ